MKLLFFLIALMGYSTVGLTQIKTITPEKAALLIKKKNVTVLDVRTESEIKEGFIPKSLNIDVLQEDRFREEIKKLNKKSKYIIYCRSGKRSLTAATIMKNQGFKNVINMEGGILNWNGPISKNKNQ